MVGQTQQGQNPDSINLINRLAEAVGGIESQQQPETSPLLMKPTISNTLFFDGKNEKFELFEDFFHTLLKMQLEMSETLKINHLNSHAREKVI